VFLASQAVVQAEEPPVRVAPDFELELCFNAEALNLADFTDNLVLLYFFDAGRVESRSGFRYLNEWYRRYENDGLQVIGIHCPALEPLKARDNAVTAISRANPKIPVGLDMKGAVCKAYSLSSLPTYLLLAPGRRIILEISDLKAFTEIEMAIQDAIRKIKPDVIHPFLLKPFKPEDDPKTKTLPGTPMIRPGYTTSVVADCDSADFGKFKIYTDSKEKTKGTIFLSGKWKADERSVSYQQEDDVAEGTLRVIYSGKEVWVLVDFNRDRPPKIFVNQDRASLMQGLWGRDLRYDNMGRVHLNLRYTVPLHVVTNTKYGAHELQLNVTGGDATFYYLFFEDGLAE
jgi:hypothetical protein